MEIATEPVFFHEDNYLQIELVPEENLFALTQQSEESAPNENTEFGFMEIHSRSQMPYKTTQKEIAADSLTVSLEELAYIQVNTVETGYGSAKITKNNTIMLGFERLGLFVETEDLIIKHLWLESCAILPKETDNSKLAAALYALGIQNNLILVDWNQEIVIRLSSIQTINNYLNEVFGFPEIQ